MQLQRGNRLRAIIGVCTVAVGLAAAGPSSADYDGTGVTPGTAGVDDSQCHFLAPPFPHVTDTCGQSEANAAGDLAPDLPGAKDPVVYPIHEAVNTWELVKSLTATGEIDMGLVPEWVKQTTAFKRFIVQAPMDDNVITALGDTVFYSTDAVVTANYSKFADCDDGAVCVSQDAEYRGRTLRFYGTGQVVAMSDYGFNDETSSWRNYKNRTDARLYDNNPPGGRSICLESSAGSSHTGGFNDKASALRIYSAGNDSSC